MTENTPVKEPSLAEMKSRYRLLSMTQAALSGSVSIPLEEIHAKAAEAELPALTMPKIRTFLDDSDGKHWFALRDVLEATGSKTRPAIAKKTLVQNIGPHCCETHGLTAKNGRVQDGTIINTEAAFYLAGIVRQGAEGKVFHEMLTIALDKEEGEGFDYVRHFFGDMRGIGTMEIEGEQWYVLSHVLTLLFESRMRFVDAKALVEEVYPEWIRKQRLHTPDGIPYGPEVVLIHVDGLSVLCGQIKTEAGKRFARWLHGEVMPSLRKDGSYFHGVPLPQGIEDMVPEEAEYIKQATAMFMGLSKKLKRREKQRLAAEILLDISPDPLQRCLDAEWGTVSSLAQVLQLPHHSQEIIDAQYSVVDILE